ncbi:MAG: hypothetical protein KJ955_06355 [Nanoarchaeota archaeon]|nr:hypothetical protein [Nanoarchaeota archaeon]
MNLLELAIKTAYHLGLTREEREGLSSVFCEDAVVTSKAATAMILQSFMPFREDYFYIVFQGETGEIEVSVPDALYRSLEEGDRIRLFYRKVFSISYNYAPPDFSERQMLETKVVDHEFVEAEKLAEAE